MALRIACCTSASDMEPSVPMSVLARRSCALLYRCGLEVLARRANCPGLRLLPSDLEGTSESLPLPLLLPEAMVEA